MQLERYDYSVNHELLQYEFYSEGPRGRFKKMVQYKRMQGEVDSYNLAFGDWDDIINDINDLIVSNNNDRERVLATVANTVISFTELRPEAMVFATGSTPARTRLYRMGIFLNWLTINVLFNVWGYINDKWELYKPNTPYEAFLVKRR